MSSRSGRHGTNPYLTYFGVSGPDAKEFESFRRWRSGNPANALHEFCLRVFRTKCTVEHGFDGPDHLRNFQCTVYWPAGDPPPAYGEGRTLKEAERAAYQAMAEQLELLVNDVGGGPMGDAPVYYATPPSFYAHDPTPAQASVGPAQFAKVFPDLNARDERLVPLLTESEDLPKTIQDVCRNIYPQVNVYTSLEQVGAVYKATVTWPFGKLSAEAKDPTSLKNAEQAAYKVLYKDLYDIVTQARFASLTPVSTLPAAATAVPMSPHSAPLPSVASVAAQATPLRQASTANMLPADITSLKAHHGMKRNSTWIEESDVYYVEMVATLNLPRGLKSMRAVAYHEDEEKATATCVTRLGLDIRAIQVEQT